MTTAIDLDMSYAAITDGPNRDKLFEFTKYVFETPYRQPLNFGCAVINRITKEREEETPLRVNVTLIEQIGRSGFLHRIEGILLPEEAGNDEPYGGGDDDKIALYYNSRTQKGCFNYEDLKEILPE